jgi:hypothetical protein
MTCGVCWEGRRVTLGCPGGAELDKSSTSHAVLAEAAR